MFSRSCKKRKFYQNFSATMRLLWFQSNFLSHLLKESLVHRLFLHHTTLICSTTIIHFNNIANEYRLAWNGNIISMPSLLFLLWFFLYLKKHYGFLRMLAWSVFCQCWVIFVNSAKNAKPRIQKKNPATVGEISLAAEFVAWQCWRKQKDILKEKFLLCPFSF